MTKARVNGNSHRRRVVRHPRATEVNGRMVASGRSDSSISHRSTAVSRQGNSVSGMVTSEVAVVSTDSSGPGRAWIRGSWSTAWRSRAPTLSAPQGNNRQQWSTQPRQPPTGPRPTSTWTTGAAVVRESSAGTAIPGSFVQRQLSTTTTAAGFSLSLIHISAPTRPY